MSVRNRKWFAFGGLAAISLTALFFVEQEEMPVPSSEACDSTETHPALTQAIEDSNFDVFDEQINGVSNLAARHDLLLSAARQALSVKAFKASRRYLNQAKNYYIDSGCELPLARALTVLARVDWHDSDYRSAIENADKALNIFDPQKHNEDQIEVLSVLINSFTATGNYSLAQNALEAKTAQMPKNDWRTRVRESFAGGLLEMYYGNYGLAALLFERALEAARDSKNRDGKRAIHLNLSRSYLETGRVALSKKHLLEAKELADPNGRGAFALIFTEGLINYHEGDYSASLAHMREALTLDQPKDWVWEMHYYAGLSAEHLALQEAANEHLLASMESVRKIADALAYDSLRGHLLSKFRQPFESAVKFRLKNAEKTGALEIIEEAKAQSFIDAFTSNANSGGLSDSLGTSKVVNRLKNADSYFNSASVSPRTKIEPVDELLDDLKEETVLIYHYFENELWCFRVRESDVKAVQISTDFRKLEKSILSHQLEPSNTEVLRELGGQLFPVGVLPAAGEHLYIVPDIHLRSVLWPSIVVGGEHLIQRNTLSFVPSLSALAAIKKGSVRRSTSPAEALIVADSQGDLPHAAQEALNIASIYDTTARLEGSALLDNWPSEQTIDVLHVGVHGGLDYLGPWLLMGNARIYHSNIVGMPQKAQLTVLASCASGTPVEENMWGSVAAGFLISGSDHVVASLRAISDSSTTDLMSEFHRNYHRSRSVSHSLALAQRSSIERGEPVESWASFVNLGLK